jgi:hypothetical protein
LGLINKDMAKKATRSTINLGLDSSTLDRLNRASQAKAGVGEEFKQTSFGEGLGNIAVNIGGKLLEDKAAENKKITEKLEGKLQKGIEAFEAIGPGENEYNYGYDKVMDLREKILNTTDEKERAKLMRDFNTYITSVKSQTESDKITAKGFKDFSLDKNKNKSLYSSASDPRSIALNNAFYNNEAEVFDGADGEKMYRITLPPPEGAAGPPDVFEGTKEDLDNMVIPRATEFDLAVGKLGLAVKKNANEGGVFDAEDIRRQIGNNLNPKDFPSLFTDKLESTGRSVIDDISSEIDNLTYQELLSPEELSKFNITPDEGEKNWYDNISPEDKAFMLQSIQQDENIGRSVLENYFFRFAQRQAGKGDKAREGQYTIKGQGSAIQAVAKEEKKKELGYGGTDFSAEDYYNETEGTETKK